MKLIGSQKCESILLPLDENEFCEKPNNGGIIKPKFSSITQIQDAQKMQKKLIDDLRKKQWGDLSTGTDEIQIINTQNVQIAKQGLVDLDHEMTAAYGLGDGGYWGNNSKTYGQGMKHAFGNIGDGIQLEQERKRAGYDAGMQHVMGNGSPEIEETQQVRGGSPPDDNLFSVEGTDSMYTGLDDVGNSGTTEGTGERRYDDSTYELFSTIKQYYLDKFDTDMGMGDFRKKYPDGSQEIQMWTDELRKKLGRMQLICFLTVVRR